MKLLLLVALLLSLNSVLAQSASSFKQLELFNKVLHLVESRYYRQVDREKLIRGAIRGMMNTLDPHSTFLSEKIFAKLKEETKGEFGGVGIEVTIKEGIIIISTTIDDTPASRAGLRSGDRILEIDHQSIIATGLEEAVDKMRGKAGTTVVLGIQRKGVDGIKHYTIKRQIIKIKPIKSALMEEQFIYLRLATFPSKSHSSMVKALKKHRQESKKKGQAIAGVILDLRFNPGGLLEQAVDVASVFLRDGIVVYTEGRNPKDREFHYVKKSGHKELEVPLVVLINGASASASEIVAGALQDAKRAVIMGSTSFGKGLVQFVAPIDEKRAIKLTSRQYMTPLGKKIQAIGIKPDVVLSSMFSQEGEEDHFIRERDLRGHLSATIETEEEKKERQKLQKEQRKKRAFAREQQKRGEEKDYQVIQALNYLKANSALKK